MIINKSDLVKIGQIEFPEKIEIEDDLVRDFLEVLKEIRSSAIYDEDYEPWIEEVIKFSPFHPIHHKSPVIIDSNGIEMFENYWQERKLKDVLEIRMRILFLLESTGLIEILSNPIDWVPFDYFGVLYQGEFEININLTALGILEKFIENNLPKNVKEIFSEKEIIVGNLKIDFKKCEISYQERYSKINPETQPIKLLVLLLKNESASYKEIAIKLDLIGYQDNANNSDISRSITFLKKNIVKKLKEIKAPESVVNGLIRTVSKYGFILNKEVLTN